MIDTLAARVRRDATGCRGVVLIDGGSGSGKTTLAGQLAAALPEFTLVHLEDSYRGWYGLERASRELATGILAPVDPGYERWDWVTNSPTTWVSIDPDASIIVEGCGTISPASAKLATTTIWLELDAEERYRRAIARDGDYFATWWDAWAAQEHALWAHNRPWELADIVCTNPPET